MRSAVQQMRIKLCLHQPSVTRFLLASSDSLLERSNHDQPARVHYHCEINGEHTLAHRSMCIRYNIEFWTPCKIESAEWERRVKRGLARPGENRDARIIDFYECNGAHHRYARCAPDSTQQGGCYRGRIMDFCYEDQDCFLRMVELQAACTVAKRAAQAADQEREHPDIQLNAQKAWKKAYDEWTSAYDHHRECPWRRYSSELFRLLKRAGIVMDRQMIDDQTRMGAHPGSQKEPIVGIQRHYDAPPRRY